MDKLFDGDQTPSFEEFQRELSKFMKERFGNKAQNFAFPQTDTFRTQEESPSEKKKKHEINFRLKPKEVRAYLDRFVIQQDEAKKVLSVAVCDHYHHVANCLDKQTCKSYAKQNVVLIGPTGVGKTYLVRMIADMIGVPFVKSDATKFSETGYVGGDVEDLIRDLVHKADGDIDLAQYGIIYLDEVDKIAAPANIMGRDVSGQGVQRGLLKLMEETEVPLKSTSDLTSQIQAVMEYQTKGKIERKTVNTRHILFIMSGAFDGLSEIIRKRSNVRSIGFAQNLETKKEAAQFLKVSTTNDFIKYGFDPEFISRLPVRVVLNDLTEEDLYKILKNSEDSVIKQYVADFHSYGIEAVFLDDALKAIARKAASEKTGARGLFTICEKILRDFKYEFPSTGIKRFLITPALIEDPQKELQHILKDPSYIDFEFILLKIQAFEKDYESKYGVKINFDTGAQEWITKAYHENSLSVEDLCLEKLKNYEYALPLIRQNSGREVFEITRDVLNSPKETLDQWIKESYTPRKKRPSSK